MTTPGPTVARQPLYERKLFTIMAPAPESVTGPHPRDHGDHNRRPVPGNGHPGGPPEAGNSPGNSINAKKFRKTGECGNVNWMDRAREGASLARALIKPHSALAKRRSVTLFQDAYRRG